MNLKDFFNSQRKNYFINARFQLKYSFLLALLGSIISAFIILAVIFFLNNTLTIFSISGLGTIPTLMEILSDKMNDLIITIAFLFSIQAICLLLIGIYTTHKICGPIYVLERSLKKVTRGLLSEKMSLRKSDDFQTLPTAFNKMIQKLQTKTQEDIIFLQHVESEIAELETNNAIPPQLEEEFSKLKTQAKFLREQKSYSIK
jgi:methyl-accepting chemotaxis protein